MTLTHAGISTRFKEIEKWKSVEFKLCSCFRTQPLFAVTVSEDSHAEYCFWFDPCKKVICEGGGRWVVIGIYYVWYDLFNLILISAYEANNIVLKMKEKLMIFRHLMKVTYPESYHHGERQTSSSLSVCPQAITLFVLKVTWRGDHEGWMVNTFQVVILCPTPCNEENHKPYRLQWKEDTCSYWKTFQKIHVNF